MVVGAALASRAAVLVLQALFRAIMPPYDTSARFGETDSWADGAVVFAFGGYVLRL
jgi:hypothetical protein